MSETPKTDCKGCDGRDLIIEGLSRRIDELEGNGAAEIDEVEALIMFVGALK